tara:strand:+ start:4982 stop:5623 length:642 start_codon:yes stop_codon:yes gene_type:complete
MGTLNLGSGVDNETVNIKYSGIVDYISTWKEMKDFTLARTRNTPDEIWFLQHPPVYTLGVAGKMEHLLRNNGISIIRSDRGGQITYHGPGQIIAYLLLDVRRLKLGIRELIKLIEDAVIDLLEEYAVNTKIRKGAPGVYVGNKKIASLGLKIKNGCCYHGVALNVDMDLEPFSAINPCGYSGLEVTQVRDLGINDSVDILAKKLSRKLRERIF